jgi:hypothetical protein
MKYESLNPMESIQLEDIDEDLGRKLRGIL